MKTFFTYYEDVDEFKNEVIGHIIHRTRANNINEANKEFIAYNKEYIKKHNSINVTYNDRNRSFCFDDLLNKHNNT